MPNREWYQSQLENIPQSPAKHSAAYDKARSAFGTNRKAHEATKKEPFYAEGLAPVLEGFLAGEPAAIDEVFTFLEIDTPAFRSGYSKEWYYRKLKRTILSEEQIQRLRKIALARCRSNDYRREDGELRRLMIQLADEPFVRQVAAIPGSQGSTVEDTSSGSRSHFSGKKRLS